MITAALDRSQAETKLRRHRRSFDMFEEAIPRSRLIELLRFEIEALEHLPPAAVGERSTA